MTDTLTRSHIPEPGVLTPLYAWVPERCLGRLYNFFFVVLVCHYPPLDGFDQHFEATYELSHWLTSTIFSYENIFGMLGIEPGAAGSRSE